MLESKPTNMKLCLPLFLASLVSTTTTACVDDPVGWFDSDGPYYDCDWYSVGNRCAIYGDGYADSNGITANMACCACGGGAEGPPAGPSPTAAPSPGPTESPTKSPTAEPTPAPVSAPLPTEQVCVDDPLGWYDIDGPVYDCEWYSQGTRCADYGDDYERLGTTANQACCACGGGTLGTSPPVPAPAPTVPINSDGLQPSCFTFDNSFNMCLDLLDTRASGFQPWMTAFGSAKAKWENIITGDLPDVVNGGFSPSICGDIPNNFDDMYLCGKAEPIDGLYGVLGSAGPTSVRNVNGKILPVTGQMRFDTADIDNYLNTGNFAAWEAIIVHEAAHVIGIGTLWNSNNLYSGGEFYADGTNAKNQWNAIGCSGRLPIETDGGPGTAGGHWDDACLAQEVMTGYLSSNSIFSAITVGSLDDLGYTVDYTAAEPFGISDLGTCENAYCPEANRRRLGESRGLQGNGNGNGNGNGGNNGQGNGNNGNGNGQNRKRKKPISNNGLGNMKRYAAQEMRRLRQADYEVPEGVEFIGGDLLIVSYREDGENYSFTFRWDDVKDFAPPG